MFVNVNLIETLGYRLSSMLFRGSVNSGLGVSYSQPHYKVKLTGRKEEVFQHNTLETLNGNLLQSYHLSTTLNGFYNIRRKT